MNQVAYLLFTLSWSVNVILYCCELNGHMVADKNDLTKAPRTAKYKEKRFTLDKPDFYINFSCNLQREKPRTLAFLISLAV